jgi:hypothetical protein
MKECDLNAERSSMYGCLLKEKKKAGVQLSLDCCFKKVQALLLKIKINYLVEFVDDCTIIVGTSVLLVACK